MKKRWEPLPQFLHFEDPKVEAVLCDHIAQFRGQGPLLASAIGALVFGQHYGSRVLRMVHSPSTYRKYEKILGIKFDELCPETTHLSEKNLGFKVAKKVGAFWDVVMGRNKVEKKGWIGEEDGDSR